MYVCTCCRFIDLDQVVSVQAVSTAQQDKNNATFLVQCSGRTFQLQAHDEVTMRKSVQQQSTVTEYSTVHNQLYMHSDTILLILFPASHVILFLPKGWFTIYMTLGAASCCIASILGQVGRLCPKSTSLGRKQERYVGYAGIEFGSIPAASRCVSTAFQRGMTRRDAAPSVIL